MESKKKDLIIMKFGGSCLQNAKSFDQITKIINTYLHGSKLLIVSSAIKGITDKLLKFYTKSCNEELDCEALLTEISNTHNSLINQIFSSRKEEYINSLGLMTHDNSTLNNICK
ncbi:MAG: hypothetical protein ACFFC3_13025 [Candidatus Odinarchaeota archaeon]